MRILHGKNHNGQWTRRFVENPTASSIDHFMTPDTLKRIEDLMTERGLNPTSLARLAGIGQTGVKAILDGRVRSTRIETIVKLAKALGVSVSWLVTGDEDFRARVPIVGVVSAGEGWTEQPDDSTEHVEFTLGGDDMIAVEIHGDSMLPTYRATDILICRRQSGRSIAEQVGKDCVLRTSDGRHLVKILKKGSRPGLYTLKSYNPHFDDIDNVSLAWVAPVVWVKRRG